MSETKGESHRDDEAAIERLINLHNYVTDHQDFAAWADLFTEDALFYGAYGVAWRVHEQWREFGLIAAARAAELGPTRHWVTNIMTDVHGDRATSSSFVMMTRVVVDGKQSVALTAEYDDRLRRVGNRWLFTRRRVLVDTRSAGNAGVASGSDEVETSDDS